MKFQRMGIVLLLFVCLSAVLIAQDATATEPIVISARWEGDEAAGLEAVINSFTEATGIEVIYESNPTLVQRILVNAATGNTPDIALIPRPGVIRDLVSANALVPLNAPTDPILSSELIESTLTENFVDLGTFDEMLYGLIVKANSKSTFWYKPASFEALAVEIPTTWRELQAITQAYMDDGQIPFVIGGGDAWTLTDWFENIYIRLHGASLYNQLFVEKTLSWQDTTVIQTFRVMFDLLNPLDTKLIGGKDSILTYTYQDSVKKWLGDDEPAAMYYEGGFLSVYAQQEFPDLTCGEDYSFFLFPQINPTHGNPIVGGGELAVVFNDSPDVRAFMQYLASPAAATVWVKAERGAIISPNQGVSISDYKDPCTAMEAQEIRNARTFVFDGSDLMTGHLGEYAFFVALQDYLLDPGAMTQILAYIQLAADKS